MSKENRYPRETVEFQPVTILKDGEPVTTAVEFAIIANGDRPLEADWGAAIELDSRIGVMVAALEPGPWNIWARVTDTPEIPVLDCGVFRVT